MNEFEFIEKYLKPLITAGGAAKLEDDVAILKPFSGPQIVTTDTIVEARHFRATDPWDTIGKKLVRVNVSDCIAKGALPRACLLNLTWNRGLGEDALACFIAGLANDLSMFGIELLGGDTTSHSGPAVFSLTLFGECLRDTGPVRRNSAGIGDDLWVTGTIGDAGIGLDLAEGETQASRELRDKYLTPELQDMLIAHLVSEFASASMDVSDGLLQDASHICSVSGVGVEIELTDIPISNAAERHFQKNLDADDIIRLASMGDDYQVLFSANRDQAAEILTTAKANGLRVTKIGRTIAGRYVSTVYRGERVEKTLTGGWQHSMCE